jgi:hypothetical protein
MPSTARHLASHDQEGHLGDLAAGRYVQAGPGCARQQAPGRSARRSAPSSALTLTIDLVEIVIGLIGVVAGGLVTGASSLYLEWRRERGELRQAKRLAAEELHTVWAHLLLLAEHRKTPTLMTLSGDDYLPTRDWHTNRAVLARWLSDDHWSALPKHVHNVEQLRRHILASKPGSPLPPGHIRMVGEMAGMTASFYESLTGEPPYEFDEASALTGGRPSP